MDQKNMVLIKTRAEKQDYLRLIELGNESLVAFVADAVELCEPEKLVVLDDSKTSIEQSRVMAVKEREELPLKIEGHTVHFDGLKDQGRDREVTLIELAPAR